MEEIDVNQMSQLVWAYIGDSVYEQYIRNYLVTSTKYKPHKLHIEATKFVKAAAQAKILQQLEENLTDDEKEIVRRARNTKNHHLPKNSNVQEYMYATAFEGLIGYLHLSKSKERLKEILDLSLKYAV
jgi:ribonuclease-3 family protein